MPFPSAPFNYTNGTLAGQNIMYFFTYANDVTGGLFVIFMLIAFFLVILISSLIMQQRFTARIKFETSLLAASFSTLGLAVILEQVTGALGAPTFIVLIILTIFAFFWLALSNE